MTDDQIALARRAVACRHWRWMPGMLVRESRDIRVSWVDRGHLHGNVHDGTMRMIALASKSLPDLTDPATIGCLLALVREAWGDPRLCANDAGPYDMMFWHVYTDGLVSCGCQTEAEALVTALEAANG